MMGTKAITLCSAGARYRPDGYNADEDTQEIILGESYDREVAREMRHWAARWASSRRTIVAHRERKGEQVSRTPRRCSRERWRRM